MESSKKYNLEERLIDFSILILDVIEQLPNDKIGNHLGGQLLRSGTSPALNYERRKVQSLETILFIR